MKNVYLITGSPAAGKSTYAKENAGKNDIIFDLDEVNKALGSAFREDKPCGLDVALAMRKAAIDEIAKRTGKWENAYFITASSDRAEINQLLNTLGAEEVAINTPIDECKRRAMADETRADKDKALGLIDDWHSKAQGSPKSTNEIFAEWFNENF